MRFLYTIFFLLITLSIAAQKVPTLKEVLKTAAEISITDSILINYYSLEKTELDKTTAESFFKLIYPNEKQEDPKAEYFVAGKITLHKDFDILILCAEKTDKNRTNEWNALINRSSIKELFFVLFDKKGNYKNSFLGALNYETSNYFRKTAIRKISSWIYKDLKIVQYVEAESGPANFIIKPFGTQETRKMNFSMEYHINDYGVFVAYPKFKSN